MKLTREQINEIKQLTHGDEHWRAQFDAEGNLCLKYEKLSCKQSRARMKKIIEQCPTCRQRLHPRLKIKLEDIDKTSPLSKQLTFWDIEFPSSCVTS